MSAALKAHVRQGQIVLDEPTELPEGIELIVGVTLASVGRAKSVRAGCGRLTSSSQGMLERERAHIVQRHFVQPDQRHTPAPGPQMELQSLSTVHCQQPPALSAS